MTCSSPRSIYDPEGSFRVVLHHFVLPLGGVALVRPTQRRQRRAGPTKGRRVESTTTQEVGDSSPPKNFSFFMSFFIVCVDFSNFHLLQHRKLLTPRHSRTNRAQPPNHPTQHPTTQHPTTEPRNTQPITHPEAERGDRRRGGGTNYQRREEGG